MATPRERHDPWHSELTYIIGHQRPDMDAIASAIGYAWCLSQIRRRAAWSRRGPGRSVRRRRLPWAISALKPPRVLSSAAPTFAHVASHQEPVMPDAPLAEAMARLAQGERLVPVVDGEGQSAGRADAARARPRVCAGRRAASGTRRRRPAGHISRSCRPCPRATASATGAAALLRGGGEEFLIVEDDGHYLGTATRQCLLEPPRARLILVDHNELAQAVPGADEAEIVGVLDHHRLGNAPTALPIPFVVEPVGSTSTLVAEACRRRDVTPPPEIAGMLLSGILSDTLVFRSPTVTAATEAAEWLAHLSDVDVLEYGQHLIQASPGLVDRSADDIVDGDRKNYEMAGQPVSVAQVEVTGLGELPSAKPICWPPWTPGGSSEGLALICLMVTDVITIQSRLLCRGDRLSVRPAVRPRRCQRVRAGRHRFAQKAARPGAARRAGRAGIESKDAKAFSLRTV